MYVGINTLRNTSSLEVSSFEVLRRGVREPAARQQAEPGAAIIVRTMMLSSVNMVE
jgi:hypothetical protein